MALDKHQQWVADGLEQPGKNQSDLARHLGLTPDKINKIVRGKRRVKAHEIEAIAAYLGIPAPTDADVAEYQEFLKLYRGASAEARKSAEITLRLGQIAEAHPKPQDEPPA